LAPAAAPWPRLWPRPWPSPLKASLETMPLEELAKTMLFKGLPRQGPDQGLDNGLKAFPGHSEPSKSLFQRVLTCLSKVSAKRFKKTLQRP